jgi:D-alanyl-lipoteichoic acid acyltransferase DltB (MBOAT superfamily)
MLLIASYIFYGSWNWRFLSLILISTTVDYFCGLKIHNTHENIKRKKYLIISLICNLGLLGFFKYFNFFIANAQQLLAHFGLQANIATLKIVLPVGISFYTFQTLSYTIDIYYKKLKPEHNFLNFALFVAFFPQLVAGPIERAKRLLPQVSSPRKVTKDNIKEGLFFISWGYFLKIFVADNMALIVNQIFAQKGIIPGLEAILGSYAFAFQIFGDFAGYSFIAIGVSKLLGFHLMTNFLFPYFVTKPSAFWKNWHISLSSWLRDYLYIPLGGNRKGTLLTYRNLLITMFLGGLWHGAGWTFIIWGLYQGFILIIFRLVNTATKRTAEEATSLTFRKSLKIFGMFQLTCLGWLIFRAENVLQIKNMLNSIFFNLNSFTWEIPYYFLTIIFYTWLLFIVQVIQKKNNNLLIYQNLSYKAYLTIYMLMFYLIIIWGEFGGQQFIYFQF